MTPDVQTPLRGEVGSSSQLVDADDSGCWRCETKLIAALAASELLEAAVTGEPASPTYGRGGRRDASRRQTLGIGVDCDRCACRPGNIEGAHGCRPDVPAVSECAR